jgi:hypothetical protein
LTQLDSTPNFNNFLINLIRRVVKLWTVYYLSYTGLAVNVTEKQLFSDPGQPCYHSGQYSYNPGSNLNRDIGSTDWCFRNYFQAHNHNHLQSNS